MIKVLGLGLVFQTLSNKSSPIVIHITNFNMLIMNIFTF